MPELECIKLRLLALEYRTREALKESQSHFLSDVRVMLKATLDDIEASLELINSAIKKENMREFV